MTTATADQIQIGTMEVAEARGEAAEAMNRVGAEMTVRVEVVGTVNHQGV